MNIQTLIQLLETKIPPSYAFAGDKIGLQVGYPIDDVSGIYITLDVEIEDIALAQAAEANLIISHHAVIKEPMTHLCAGTRQHDIVRALLASNMAVYNAHTNFDNSPYGMGGVLCKRIGLSNAAPMAPPPCMGGYKIAVFVPPADRDKLLHAMSEAGAGVIGDYTLCSFSTPGTGTFMSMEGTSPTIGESGLLEEVEEIRMEMVVPKEKLEAVVAAMITTHPYEEVAYDVYPMAEHISPIRYCWSGTFEEPLPWNELVQRVEKSISLKTPPHVFTLSRDDTRPIHRVGICPGGIGARLQSIMRSGIDAFIVGELGYGKSLEVAHAGLPTIEAGHAETERFFVSSMAALLKTTFKKELPPLILSNRYPL
jgi:dinuclear metal center YbgI/SA1388 family protein